MTRLLNRSNVLCSWMVALLLTATALSARADIVTGSLDYEHQGVTLSAYIAQPDGQTGPKPGVLLAPHPLPETPSIPQHLSLCPLA